MMYLYAIYPEFGQERLKCNAIHANIPVDPIPIYPSHPYPSLPIPSILFINHEYSADTSLHYPSILAFSFTNLQLSDMRYSKRMDGSRCFTICGDPLYFAPEIIRQQGE